MPSRDTSERLMASADVSSTRIVLDTNIWSYIGQGGEADAFEELARAKHIGVVVPPSVLLEVMKTPDPSALAQIVDAVTRGARDWTHPPTEARQLAEEVVSEIRRLRPAWVRTFPETSNVERLEKFWTKRIWQKAAADPVGVAERVNSGSEMAAADRDVYEIQQENRQRLLKSGARTKWEIEPHVDLSNQLEHDRLGWEGERIAFWRVDSAMTWWEVMLHGASGRVPLHSSLHDWLDPWSAKTETLRNEGVPKSVPKFGLRRLFSKRKARVCGPFAVAGAGFEPATSGL
jgi:hypothetical protein